MASGGGIKVANNLITTEEGFALDARQGKILNEYITQVNADLLKMIQESGVITHDDDWNNYMTAGIYKVQNANMIVANHAPVGLYAYGILQVLVAQTSSEKRTTHIYYPHSIRDNGIAMATRMYNHMIGTDYSDLDWKPWYGIQGTLLTA